MHIGVIGSGTSARTLPAHLLELGTGAIEPRIVNPRLSAFAFTPYERLVVDLAYVDAAQLAERAGAAAVYINSFADYGIDAMRAALSIPVIGSGEATLQAAARNARRFAIVTVWPRSLGYLYEERLRALALTDQCLAIRHLSPEDELARVGSEDGVMPRMQRGESSIVAQLREACARAVRQDGAECIVLGCTCMAPVAAALEPGCPVPLLECSRVGFRAALTALRVQRGGAAPRESASRGQWVPALIDAWIECGSQTPPAGAIDCPVCIAEPPGP